MASITAGPAREPSAPLLRTPQIWLFRVLPLRLAIPTLLVAAAVMLTATSYDASPRDAIGCGALVFLIALTRVRGTSLAAVLDEKLTFRRQALRNRSASGEQTEFEVPLPEGGSYGIRWDGTNLITMLRIEAQPRFVTLLGPGVDATGERVPLPELARCLNQFDIDLASIEVISTGSRTSDVGTVARLYDQVLGPLPAVAHRTVWVVLRLNPLANTSAVASRGGGSTGTLRSAIICTRRVANRLAARGLTVSVLSGAEITAAVHQLTRGIALDQFTEAASSLEHDGMYFATYRMDLAELGPRGFADVWATPSLTTTINLRLSQVSKPIPANESPHTPTIGVAATARFDTRHAPASMDTPGLISMSGKQYRALLYSLPIGTERAEIPIEGSLGTPDSLADFSMPIAGCGQLLGADSSWQGVAMTLVGRHVRRVEIVGSLLIAKQAILRAIALGASVLVHTNRHEAWRDMVAYVDSAQALSLAAWSVGSQQANVNRSADVIVYDGIPPSPHHADATVVLLQSRQDAESFFEPDIILREDPQTANLVTVHTSGGSTSVRIVATPNEMTFLGESHTTPM